MNTHAEQTVQLKPYSHLGVGQQGFYFLSFFSEIKYARIVGPEGTLVKPIWPSPLISEMNRLRSGRKAHSRVCSEWLADSGQEQVL